MRRKPLAALAGATVAIGALLPVARAHQESASPIDTELETINRALFTGGRAPALQYADRLKALGAQKLTDSQRETWVRVCRDAALRLGDRAWLESLREVPDAFSQEMIYRVLLAYGQLGRADLTGAEKTLATLASDEKAGRINVREQRRITAIRARIAQLRGDDRRERAEIESLIGHLPYWPTDACQRCHNAPKTPKEITSLPIASLWFGERFVEILRRDGDAQRVRQQSEAQLAQNPADVLARIRLGYALQALGQEADATKTLQALSWTEAPGRDLKKPRMVTTFP